MAKSIQQLEKEKEQLIKEIRSAKSVAAGVQRIAQAHVKKALGGSVFALARDSDICPELKMALQMIVEGAEAGIKSSAGKALFEELKKSFS